jgi:hypothetical protein
MKLLPEQKASLRADVLRLSIPDWSAVDQPGFDDIPFVLWPVGDQPLLYHWLNYALNEGYQRVDIYCIDRPSLIRQTMEAATLWPIEWNIYPVEANATVQHFKVTDRLPWVASNPPPLDSSWDLLLYWRQLEKSWFEYIFNPSIDDVIGSNVGNQSRIHSSVKMVMPVHIGSNVFIGRHSVIGPNVVIEDNCVLDGKNVLKNARVGSHTFMGKHTGLDEAYLKGRTLINFRHRAIVEGLDDIICDDFRPSRNRASSGERLYALLFFIAFLLRSLVPLDPKAFWRQRLKSLLMVLVGNRRLFGLLPRTEEHLEGVRKDWRKEIEKAPVGVFSYSDTKGCYSANDEGELIHAIFQASHVGEKLNRDIAAFVWRSLWTRRPPA